METIWYALVLFVLTTYVVLDGYDFGVGILSPFVARQESERRLVRETIGPVWTGNEVWVIAGSALLFLAFPKAFASGFSGFYLALMIMLWLLMGRGLPFELREHVNHALWRTFWGYDLLSGQSAAGLRGGAGGGESAAGRSFECERLFLPSALDRLQPRFDARHSGLVHSADGADPGRPVDVAGREFPGHEDARGVAGKGGGAGEVRNRLAGAVARGRGRGAALRAASVRRALCGRSHRLCLAPDGGGRAAGPARERCPSTAVRWLRGVECVGREPIGRGGLGDFPQSVDCDDRTGQQSHEPQRRNRPDRPRSRSLVGAPGPGLGDPVSSADSSPLRPPGQAWIFSGGAPLAFPPFYGVRSCN
ncbi:MAG: cytochrome d ubiquinol oxidase subunit II [Nitrospira sp.]|nr:cytochrome d ubiquinol oxidase subunit II [Nitrospira sp.]